MATPTQKRLIQKRFTDIRKAKNTPWSQRFKWTGFSGRTLWDWLNLLATLLIPIVVVGATIGFGWWQAHLADVQHQQDQQSATLQHQQDQQSATLQHQQDQQSALDQQRAAILQTYIDNIQDLLLNHHLLISKPTDDVAVLARARTLTALQGLDPNRKGSLVQFIYEAQLIGFVSKHGGIIDLSYADLNRADFLRSNLSYADLNQADLSYADLGYANLVYADLSYANLNRANLSYAHLGGADLNEALLGGADLSGANLNQADLSFADLGYANLSGASNLTQRQLDQVFICQGAILPQGLTCYHNYVSSG